MKQFILAIGLLAASTAFAGDWYGSATYDQKDKQNSAQVNHVYGVNIGNKLGDGWVAEGRMENEKVSVGDGTQKQEGLMHVKLTKEIDTGTFLTPYAGVALGQKNKSTSDFAFWVGEVGVKAKLNDTFSVKYNWRQRTAFDSVNDYDTKENSVSLGINLTKVDAVSVSYKQERGTSDYNTTGVAYTRSF